MTTRTHVNANTDADATPDLNETSLDGTPFEGLDVQTPPVDTNPYPNVKTALDALLDALKDAASDALASVTSAYTTKLAGLRAVDDGTEPAITTAILALEAKIESERRDAGRSIVKQIRAAYADDFALLTPPAPVTAPPANAPRERAGVAARNTSNILTLADGIECQKRTMTRESFTGTTNGGCGRIGCELCLHASKAAKMGNYASYKATLDKLIPSMTSDMLMDDDGSPSDCLMNVYVAGFEAFPAAVTYSMYFPTR